MATTAVLSPPTPIVISHHERSLFDTVPSAFALPEARPRTPVLPGSLAKNPDQNRQERHHHVGQAICPARAVRLWAVLRPQIHAKAPTNKHDSHDSSSQTPNTVSPRRTSSSVGSP